MHQVLISYSNKDKKWADAACSVLEARGIRCWIAPRDIVAGTEWGAAIIAGIDDCKVMVVIFSASANESAQVRREVERAISKGRTVVPCRVENVRPIGAMEYALGNTHWLDAFTPPVERQMIRLAESVEALLLREGGASKIAVGPLLASDPAGPSESRRVNSNSQWNWRWNHRWVAVAGFALFVSLATGLMVVLWPRKEAASILKNAPPQEMVAMGATPVAPVTRSGSSPNLVAPTVVPDNGYVPLFNGKDLTGWERSGNSNVAWKVENGVLHGRWPPRSDVGGGANIYTTRNDYQNFRFRIEMKLCRHWNSSMVFSFQLNPATGRLSVPWYRADTGAAGGPDVGKTAVLRHSPARTPLAAPHAPIRLNKDEWFWQEVVVEGKHIRIYVNDVLRTDYEDNEMPRPGHVGFALSGGSSVEIRHIDIKELPANQADIGPPQAKK